MPQVNYTATIDIARPDVWEFVKDMNNWAPFAQGYQEHEVINERESVWTVKGEVGPISRLTQFHVKITEGIEGEGVEFTLDGLNEPITGGGSIRLVDSESLRDTPARVARMYEELFAGLAVDPREYLKVGFQEGHQEMVILRDLPFYSLCEHHLLPFHGRVQVGYIP